MEKRLARLAVLYEADAQAVREASYSIEWALRWPRMGLRDADPDPDPAERAAGIATTHGLGDASVRRATEVALIRAGATLAEARAVAALGLERVLVIAAEAPEVA